MREESEHSGKQSACSIPFDDLCVQLISFYLLQSSFRGSRLEHARSGEILCIRKTELRVESGDMSLIYAFVASFRGTPLMSTGASLKALDLSPHRTRLKRSSSHTLATQTYAFHGRPPRHRRFLSAYI